MKQISLDSICMRGFRSFVQPTVIEFSATSGLKFISGSNRVEPALGANGAGKSSVFDAVVFALYGTAIRGLRASELISYGQRTTEVLLILRIDGELNAIARNAPPNRITINDQPAEQADIENLVGLSRARFLNSVVFGQAVPLFIDLPVPARGDLLDEVLNLEIWMLAARKATQHHNQGTVELTNLQLDIARTRGMIEGLPDIAQLEANDSAWEAQRKARLQDLISRYETLQSELQELQKQQESLAIDRAAITTTKTKYDRQRELVIAQQRASAAAHTERNRILSDIMFFDGNQNCPTCGQDITKDFAHEHLSELRQRQMQLDADLVQIATRLTAAELQSKNAETAWQGALTRVAASDNQKSALKGQLLIKEDLIIDVQQAAIRVRNETNPYSEQLANTRGAKQRLEGRLAAQLEVERERLRTLTTLSYWRRGFGEVRLFCLENVLAELSLETRNCLLALGLHDWHVAFVTATETKAETQRLGVQVQVRPPQQQIGRFDILSGGEGQRARLAGSLGLANLVQRWAGVSFNFEVWDEPTAWLSEQGVEDLLDCLAYRANSQHKSIYLCDHRGLSHSGFAESYLVTKDQGGSHWERV